MPIFLTKEPPYKRRADAEAEWNTCRKGLNLLLRPTELGRDELAFADNIMLVGSGVPTGRWGTEVYFNANVTGSIRGFGKYKSNDGTTDEFFALTDEGFLAKKNDSSYTVITGQSWPSGTMIHSEQLGGTSYVVSEDVDLTSYAGSTLTVFSKIGAPTGLYATNFSGATGSNRSSYKIVAIGANGGQTTPSTNYVLSNLPTTLSDSEYHLFWTAPSCATLSGYEVYRGRAGDETFLATTDPTVTKYIDRGEEASQTILTPATNTTGGVKSNFIVNYNVLDPKYNPISTSVGCSNQDTIQTVENDSFYFGRNGVYVTGYEPNFLNIIRTNEVSAKMRPYLDTLNQTDYQTACALYVDHKYILSFPQKKEMIMYDRERGAWTGPWRFPFGISHMAKYIDT